MMRFDPYRDELRRIERKYRRHFPDIQQAIAYEQLHFALESDLAKAAAVRRAAYIRGELDKKPKGGET